MKNTGRPSEDIFDAAWAFLGKAAHVYVFTDASAATGLNKTRTFIPAQPSDRIVTFEGAIHFAEVKSTSTEVERFEFKLLKKTQRAFATQILTAGGAYFVYMHFIQTDEWFKIPYSLIETYKNNDKSSIPKSVLIQMGLQWKTAYFSMM